MNASFTHTLTTAYAGGGSSAAGVTIDADGVVQHVAGVFTYDLTDWLQRQIAFRRSGGHTVELVADGGAAYLRMLGVR